MRISRLKKILTSAMLGNNDWNGFDSCSVCR